VEPISERLNVLVDNGLAERTSRAAEEEGPSFADIVQENIAEVNELEKEADQLTEDFALGKTDNIHDVAIATEKARIALDLTLEVQRRVVDAFDEVMRMQI